MSRLVSLGLLSLVLAACGNAPPPRTAERVAIAVAPPPPPPPDVLGPMPVTPPAPAYLPPLPTVFSTRTGLTVWLLERHSLPYVSLALTVPAGSAADPKGQGGLAYITAEMLDEGAGARGAIELSRAIDALGASLSTSANADESRVSLSVLSKNLPAAFALFGDVIARPRFDAAEWKRLHDIVHNDLIERQSDPDEVARVVQRAVLFGAEDPYGHPVEGTLVSSKKWTRDSALRFYEDNYRPDRAILVAVGDITRSQITSLVEGKAGLGTWLPPKTPAPAPVAPGAPSGPWPKLVLVDRPDAPQSVISVIRAGIAAGDPVEPVASRANITLGGLFTSRLNQDLREEHGYTYGAHSHLSFSRGVGAFVASAAVVTDKTVDALKAMLGDIDDYARNGLMDVEVDKGRSQSRGELVETFEGVDHAAAALALDAALGLGPDFERTSAKRKEDATKPELDVQAKARFDAGDAVVVVVGPRATLEGPLHALGYKDIELRDAEGAKVPAVPPAPASRAK